MQMNRNAIRPPRYRGFTLIEALAVVALLAVIAVMGTPSFVAWHVRDQVDARAKALASTHSLCAQ
jgi:type IV fimbrial biogenesis protein FimT